VLRRDAEAPGLFQDDVLSGVVVVSLPEDMPVTETIGSCAPWGDLHLPVVRWWSTGPDRFTRCEGGLIGSDGLLEVDIRYEDPGEHALAVAAHRAARESLQARCIARLEEALSTQLTLLPFLLDGAGTPEGVRVLAAKLG
jgi:hypothetical protein